MTGAALYFPNTFSLIMYGFFPQFPTIPEREKRDSCKGNYSRMLQQGQLFIKGERTVCVKGVLKFIYDRFSPQYLVADRYKRSELLDQLDACNLNPTVVWRGQGYRDGGQDVRLFRRAALEGRVKTKNLFGSSWQMATVRTSSDPSGNEKIDRMKRKQNAKDDLIVSAVLSVAQGERLRPSLRNKRPLRVAIV